jgi:hypothetical protein
MERTRRDELNTQAICLSGFGSLADPFRGVLDHASRPQRRLIAESGEPVERR